jgi:hypothetical protein
MVVSCGQPSIFPTRYREIGALTAMRGITMKQFILKALGQARKSPAPSRPKSARKFPSVHLRSRRTLKLDDFNFDDLLAGCKGLDHADSERARTSRRQDD